MEEVPIETTDDKKATLPAWSKHAVIAFIAVAILIHLILSGWGRYGYMFVVCGVRQPLIAYSIQASQIYYTPDNRRYSAPGEGASFVRYYCTEPQARADGFLRAGP